MYVERSGWSHSHEHAKVQARQATASGWRLFGPVVFTQHNKTRYQLAQLLLWFCWVYDVITCLIKASKRCKMEAARPCPLSTQTFVTSDKCKWYKLALSCRQRQTPILKRKVYFFCGGGNKSLKPVANLKIKCLHLSWLSFPQAGTRTGLPLIAATTFTIMVSCVFNHFAVSPQNIAFSCSTELRHKNSWQGQTGRLAVARRGKKTKPLGTPASRWKM